MASIMTNASAMTALQTLRRVTGDLDTTQDRISTGLKVNNAKDNAAYWSIATTMKADVAGFKAVKESLELGTGTTNTASVAAKN
ncbi:MAG TPA: flagellin, partial [Azospirillum sp.]|nr:flagellin [Azospirillum sp.]